MTSYATNLTVSRPVLERSLAIRRELHRRQARRDLLTWATDVLAPLGQSPAAPHRLIIRELQAVADGATDRLMLFLPPGSAKSTYASVIFPPWFLAQRAGLDVIGASYNADLAEDFSARVLGIIREHGGTLGYGLASDAAKLWRTSSRGTYRAAGAGGGITGRRADLFVIDDPIKGREDADSLLKRDKVWDWYRAEVITRLKPGARIVLIQTRWHEDDLAGRLLQDGAADWRVVRLPALAEPNDPLGREVGDPIWPEWENAAALERKRREVGEREWASLYQQNPRPLEGSLFHVAKITMLDAAPVYQQPGPGPVAPTNMPGKPVIVRSWDLAATEQTGTRDPDWTVGIKMMREPNGRFVILDAVRLRGGPEAVETAIVNTAAQDGREVSIRLPEDPGQAGKSQAQYLGRRLAGSRVTAVRETGSKATRAAPFASQVNMGNVAMVKGPWNRAVLDCLAGFPDGGHDDDVDAASGAFAALMQVVPATVRRLGY
jgi:predicted phage terminase large subunit-like protein